LRPLLGDRRGLIVGLAIGSVFSGLAEAGILAVLAQVAAALVNGTADVHVNVGPLHGGETVGALLALAFGLALFRLALQVVISYLPARIAADTQARLRIDLFASFTRASWTVQSRDREGHLQEVITDQVAATTDGALLATLLLTALLTFLVLVISALALNVTAAVLVLGGAICLFGLLRPLSTLGARRGQAASLASMDYAGGIGEAVRLAEETEVFGVAEAQRRRLEQLVANVKGPFFHLQLLARLVPGLYQGLTYLFVVAGLALVYAEGASHVESLGAVVLVLVRASTYGQQAQGAYQALRQTLPYLERVQEAQHRYREGVPPVGTRPLDRVNVLAFEKVCFAYDTGRPVLSEIDFEVGGREAIGIVGPSGAGKSTLVQILLGLRPPGSGRYLVNGVPAQEFSSADWHKLVAYVPQEPRLLHASVADNIRFLRDLDDAAVEHAARLAGIHDDIVKWPDGYETIVGPRADAVSGGQQQRICLARALAPRPEVLILDEPTSALDPHSELLIQESLVALKDNLTLFIVAHRMSTLEICERTMVVVDGRLEAFGTATLLRDNNAYYRSASALAAGVSLADS
jgi:ABC-type multidrug transport system fused ATPase/permease subunit